MIYMQSRVNSVPPSLLFVNAILSNVKTKIYYAWKDLHSENRVLKALEYKIFTIYGGV